MFNEKIRNTENWFRKEKNIKLISFGAVVAIAIIAMFIYTLFNPKYSFEDLLSWKTFIDTMFITILLYMVQISVNQWSTSLFRSGELFESITYNILSNKKEIEIKGYTKELQLKIDDENVTRKINAYIHFLDKKIYEIDKYIIKLNNKKIVDDNKITELESKITSIEEEKYQVLNKKIDIINKHITYDRITKTSLYSGSGIDKTSDINIEDNSSKIFWKKTLKTRFLSIFIFVIIGGVSYNLFESRQYFLFVVFIVSMVLNILISYGITMYLEEYNTLPKYQWRQSFLNEYMNENELEIKEKEKTN